MASVAITAGVGSTVEAEKELTIPRDAEPARYVENIAGDMIIVEMVNRDGVLEEVTVCLSGIDTSRDQLRVR